MAGVGLASERAREREGERVREKERAAEYVNELTEISGWHI